MDTVEPLRNTEQSVEGRDARSKEKIVINKTEGISIDTIDGAATATLLKETEEVKVVEAVSEASENLSLTDSSAVGGFVGGFHTM